VRQVVNRPLTLGGVISPPGDKSISHRALILNGIAAGNAVVSGVEWGEDLVSTVHCLKALGIHVESWPDQGTVTIHGCGGALSEPQDALDAGNSGTSVRLLAGLLASQPFLSVLTGDASLRTRPMGRVVQPLRLMGAEVRGRHFDTLAPLSIRGSSLYGIEYWMPVASAQIKSCLLLAGLFASGDTVLHQVALSRDHTERMLKAMGSQVEEDGLIVIQKPGKLHAVDILVPGDISGAAFWIVAALCHPNADVKITGVGVNPTRMGLVEVLQAMGGDIKLTNNRHEGGEPVADICVKSSNLHGLEIGGDLIPRLIDEVQVLAVAACFASGTTTVRDAQELRVKESDRLRSTVDELSRLGANIEETFDGLAIRGTGCLQGGLCGSHGDHRLAMTLGIAGMLADSETIVEGAEVAAVSYPSFWAQVNLLCEDYRSQ
jgi:3-phosphoshikimate 1-carboxyvinyltransferase